MNQPLYNHTDIAILGMGTALPVHEVAQSDIAELIASSLEDQQDLARFAKRVFRSCGVETRYTVDPSYLGTLEDCRYIPSGTILRFRPRRNEWIHINGRLSRLGWRLPRGH